MAVAHNARSRSGRGASRPAASAGDAIRSRLPRFAGSSSPAVGLTATWSRATARRYIARNGSSVFLIVLGPAFSASSASAR